MKTYTFTLVLDQSPRIDEEIVDKLFEAGCDDALAYVRHGVSMLEFDREANSLRDAVMSAKADILSADDRLRIRRIEPEDLVSMPEMARRSSGTRENIRQIVTGQRGPKTFPLPVRGASTKSPLWSWAQVARWMADHEKLDREVARQAQGILRLNDELEQKAIKSTVQATYS
ncbi:MAG: hypothetical protein U9N87_06120 [Planctomycetota bacterium]|nr:hypothetical protein [Planctomycetota bacterium]